jgi:hypothetical protein
MNSFSSYYYKEQEALNEIYELNEANFFNKSRYASNIFRKLFGSKSLRIKPSDFNVTEEVGQKGFNELIDKLAADASDPRKESKGTWIVDAYAGKFNPKKELHPNFPPINKIEDTTVYKTNKGGKIVMYYFIDDEDDPRFFVGLDAKGERFFFDKLKKSFKVFQQQSKTGGIWQTLSKGDVEGQKPKITVVDLDKAEFDKLTPESTNIEGDYLTEEGRPLIWDSQKKIWKTQTGNKVTSFRPEDFAVNAKTGNTNDAVTKDAQKRLDKEIEKTQQAKSAKKTTATQAEPEAPKDEPKAEPEAPKDEPKSYVRKDEPKAEPEAPKDEPKSYVRKDEPKAEPEAPKDEPKKETENMGELQKKLAGDLDGYPRLIKPTKSIETGWTYLLKNDGQVYIYKLKTGEYKLGYTKKAMDILVKKGIINSKDVEALA